ncbi:MAG: hypothetical protein P4L53_06215 [Candidatus Obscuribacterales bacterium]|nr:hypothetical protein [Candidatus Obscuribacterales bacterium]
MQTIGTFDDSFRERHSYPQDLAEFTLPLLQAAQARSDSQFQAIDGFSMPSCETLEKIISCAYQASLQTDERRPVTFRLIFGAPNAFPRNQTPDGLYCFEFADTLPFDALEVAKLSSAATYHRSLIGIFLDERQELRIWGCVHSGPRWLKALQGGRVNVPDMPPALVLRVTGPGHIEVAKGAQTVGQLSEGRIFGPSMNIFTSKWLAEDFSQARSGNLALHLAARAKPDNDWADIDPDCLRILGQNLGKRMLAATRGYKHGGTILWVTNEAKDMILADGNPYIDLKYKFAPGENRSRLRMLMVEILNTLGKIGAQSDGERRTVGWKDYELSTDAILNQLDDAVFEMSNFVANLTGTDGAVVLTKGFEVLGFGGEIHCNEYDVSKIARALDLEADSVKIESIHRVGTRHRSVYRFCNAIKDATGQVISQDDNVRFVTWKNNMLTYWDHQAIADSFE